MNFWRIYSSLLVSQFLLPQRPLLQPLCLHPSMNSSRDYCGCVEGMKLVEAIVESGRSLGYGRMVLDTIPRLQSAYKIYRAASFDPCDPYYHNPLDDVIYLARNLTGKSTTV